MLRVIFRQFKNDSDDSDVIAILVDSHKDCSPGNVMTYMHVGQHGEVDATAIISITSIVRDTKVYGNLKKELESIYGQKIKVMQRLPTTIWG